MKPQTLLRHLRIEYFALLAVSLLIVLLYECGVWEKGLLAQDPQTEYAAQTLGIILTMGLIPLAIKGFVTILKKRILPLPAQEALKPYLLWSEVRIALLWVVVIISLPVYYGSSDIGLYCAIVGALASLYCFPTKTLIKRELEGDEDKWSQEEAGAKNEKKEEE